MASKQQGLMITFLSTNFWKFYVTHGFEQVSRWLNKVTSQSRCTPVNSHVNLLQKNIVNCDIAVTLLDTTGSHWTIMVCVGKQIALPLIRCHPIHRHSIDPMCIDPMWLCILNLILVATIYLAQPTRINCNQLCENPPCSHNTKTPEIKFLKNLVFWRNPFYSKTTFYNKYSFHPASLSDV